MNLLVTNTRYAQAYIIIRALRPHAEKIVATMYGGNRLEARLSHAANSRLVDKRYLVPSPVEDWRDGKIQRENTLREEAYVRAVMRICEAEKIDTIFPSFDAQVYVLAKNKERFESLGIIIPVPDYDVVITPLDKYRTIQAAQEVGFPCPKTFLPEREENLREIAEELGFPLVIKPRFTSGGRGTSIVRNLGELAEKMAKVWDAPLKPMLQEYIPGKEKQQFFLVLDQNGRLKLAFCPRTLRLFDRLYRNSSLASESAQPHAFTARAAAVARSMGSWGSVNVQTKIDARDQLPKLLEFNPRMGNHSWYMAAFGINEPLMCVDIARGKHTAAIANYPVGTMLLTPVEDFYGFGFSILDRIVYMVRTRLMGLEALDPLNTPPSIKELLRSYAHTYLTRAPKVFDPYFAHFVHDPVVSLLWWLKVGWQVLAAAKHLGR